MSEPKDRSVHGRLKRQADTLENLASESTRSSFSLNNAEEQELRELVDFLQGNLDEVRLANVQARLHDVEGILRNLKDDLAVRRDQGRPTRVIEAMVWEAENERSRVLASLSHVAQTPSRYLAFHHSGEVPRPPAVPDFAPFFQNLDLRYSQEADSALRQGYEWEIGEGGGFADPDVFTSKRQARYDRRSSMPSRERAAWDIGPLPYVSAADEFYYPSSEGDITRSVFEGVRHQMSSAADQLGIRHLDDPHYYEDDYEDPDYDSIEDSIAEQFETLRRGQKLEEMWIAESEESWEEDSVVIDQQLLLLKSQLERLAAEESVDLESEDEFVSEEDVEDDELDLEDEDDELEEDELEYEDEELDDDDLEDEELGEAALDDEELDEIALEDEDDLDEEELDEDDLDDEELDEDDLDDEELDEDDLDDEELDEDDLDDEELDEDDLDDEELDEDDLDDEELDEDDLDDEELDEEDLDQEDLEEPETRPAKSAAPVGIKPADPTPSEIKPVSVVEAAKSAPGYASRPEESLPSSEASSPGEADEESLEDFDLEGEAPLLEDELDEDELASLELETDDDELELEDESEAALLGSLEPGDPSIDDEPSGEDEELDEAELAELELDDADLDDADLEDLDLNDADLEDLDLEDADLEDLDLEDADLEDLDLESEALPSQSDEDLKDDVSLSLAGADPKTSKQEAVTVTPGDVKLGETPIDVDEVDLEGLDDDDLSELEDADLDGLDDEVLSELEDADLEGLDDDDVSELEDADLEGLDDDDLAELEDADFEGLDNDDLVELEDADLEGLDDLLLEDEESLGDEELELDEADLAELESMELDEEESLEPEPEPSKPPSKKKKAQQVKADKAREAAAAVDARAGKAKGKEGETARAQAKANDEQPEDELPDLESSDSDEVELGSTSDVPAELAQSASEIYDQEAAAELENIELESEASLLQDEEDLELDDEDLADLETADLADEDDLELSEKELADLEAADLGDEDDLELTEKELADLEAADLDDEDELELSEKELADLEAADLDDEDDLELSEDFDSGEEEPVEQPAADLVEDEAALAVPQVAAPLAAARASEAATTTESEQATIADASDSAPAADELDLEADELDLDDAELDADLEADELDFDDAELDADLEADELELDDAELDADLEADELDLDDAELDADLEADELDLDDAELDADLEADELDLDDAELDADLEADELGLDDAELDADLEADELDLDDAELDADLEADELDLDDAELDADLEADELELDDAELDADELDLDDAEQGATEAALDPLAELLADNAAEAPGSAAVSEASQGEESGQPLEEELAVLQETESETDAESEALLLQSLEDDDLEDIDLADLEDAESEALLLQSLEADDLEDDENDALLEPLDSLDDDLEDDDLDLENDELLHTLEGEQLPSGLGDELLGAPLSDEPTLLEGIAPLSTDDDLLASAPSLDALGPELGAPELEGDPDELFSGPAPTGDLGDDFFSGPAPLPTEDPIPAVDEHDEDDGFIDDLEPHLDEEEEERLEAPSKEYRSSILEALRQVQKGDAAATRADVLSVLEAAVPKEYRAAVSERRRLVRLSCEYDVNCFQGNQIFHATIRDISLGGMKIEVTRQLEAGTELQVSNPNRTEDEPDERITAQVRWYRVRDNKAEVGLQFVDPPEVLGRSWVVSLLNRVGMQSQVFNQRKYTRAAADFNIDIIDEAGDVYSGRCVDLGLGGALVDTVPVFAQNDILTFRCPSFGMHGLLEAEARVVKIKLIEEDYGRYALEFENLDAATTKLLGRYVVDLLKLGRGSRSH